MQRRKFLAQSALAALPLLVQDRPRLAIMNADIHRFSVGNAQCTIFRDLIFTYKASDYFINASPKELSDSLNRYRLQPDAISSPFIALLIQNKGKNILVDTGSGYSDTPITFRGRTFPLKGKLKSLLISINMEPEDISDVILTHFHPDHIGGLFSENKLNFPNATFHLHRTEWEYWTESRSDNENPLFKYFVEKNITPLEEYNLNLISKPEQVILEDITSIAAPGHTPGQLAIRLRSGGESLIYTSDAFLHPLHIERLDWNTNYDKDHSEARKTREKLLTIAYTENALINSFHFDFPGLGRVKKHGDKWEWDPIQDGRQ